MKYLAPIPKQFVDQSGLPLSNGAVHVYISGDTQYANVYQDADGEELMPNPARLDSNGAWLGFVTAGVPLDYVVEDKDGNVQFEYEKVVAGGGTANVAIEPTLSSGTKIAECWVDGELLELFAPEGGGDGPVYVQESHTSSDSNVTVASQKTTCTFDSNLEDFTGELHVRFQNSGQAATVTLYVNDEYNDKMVSTLPVMSGMTHLMVPLSIPAGSLRAEVTFATASTPSGVKFDLSGYNMGTGSGGGSFTANPPIKITSGVITNNGTGLTCTGDNAWAEGKSNEATGDYSHAEGQLCKAKGQASHAGGQACETSGQNSFAHGAYLKTSNQSSCQAAFGKYNSDQKAMFVIGNGTAENNRKDAFKVDSSGDTWVTIGGVLTKVTNVSGGGGQTLTFVAGGSSGGGSVTKTITLPHKYKNAFGGFISFVVKSSSSGLTRTVNWEYTVAGSGISYEVGKGQTIVVNYETKVTMPFIVSSGVPFNQITIKFTGTSADTSIYDADVFFYAEEVVEP